MLKTLPRRTMAFGCSMGVLAGLLAVAFELDFPGQICEYNQTTKHEDCTTYSLFPFLFIQIAKTLNYYGVAITAVATVAIGLFTLTLKLSTDRLWKAGEEQRWLYEDTAERQLRAYIYIQPVSMQHFDSNLFISFSFLQINAGNTPAYGSTHTGKISIEDHPLR